VAGLQERGTGRIAHLHAIARTDGTRSESASSMTISAGANGCHASTSTKGMGATSPAAPGPVCAPRSSPPPSAPLTAASSSAKPSAAPTALQR
jgi:hypothetical protein